tara:strand:- start:40031 stop:43435 length:3405 start_codon:yes stop_codon:yes gene_type:complete
MDALLLYVKGMFTKIPLFFIGFLLALSGWAQTVTTDKDDYAPGETAIITGEGWTRDQLVDLHFAEDPFVDHIHDYHDIVVNSDGTFRVEFPILERHLGVTFTLTAEGKQTGVTATRIFTDANVKFSTTGLPSNVNVTVQYQGTAPGPTSVNSFVTFSTGGGGNGASGNIALIGNLSFQFPNTITVVGTVYTLVSTSPTSPATVPTTGSFGIAATYSVSKGASTISVNAQGPFTYNTNPQGPDAVSKSGSTGSVTFSYVGVSGTIYAANTTKPTNAGNYQVTATLASDANYNGAVSAPLAFNIDKATPTATFAVSNSPQTYTGSGQSATVSISASSVPGTVTNILTGGSATQINANTYAVTADFVPIDAANYNSLIALAAGNFVIGKATPTATLAVSNSPQTYTGSGQSVTVSISASSVPGIVTNILTGGSASQTNVNTYAVTADFVPTDAANYNSLTALEVGNFVIGKATPTATFAVSNSPQTYTGAGQSATVSISASSVPGTVNNILTGGSASQTNANTYAVTADFVPIDAANYNSLIALAVGNFVIGKATSVTTVTINGDPFSYTGLPITPATVTVTGAGGVTLVTPAPTATYLNNTNAGVNTASASYTFAGDDNHLGSNDSETFTIGKAASITTVTINGGLFTYTGSAIEPATVTVTGAGGLSLTPAPVYADNTNAGTANASYSYVESANHLASSDSEDFTIGKRPITISANAGQFKYCGQADPVFEHTPSETLIAGNSFSGKLGRTSGESVNTYPYTLGTLSAGSNYSLSLVGSNTFEIQGVTIDASNSSTPVPLNQPANLTATVSPAVAGVNVTFSVTDEANATVYTTTVLTNGSGMATATTGNLGTVGVLKVTATAGIGCSISTAYIPVYDASGSFVTGGGWIMSPAGAYKADITLTGKANFGFVSKYKKGSSQVEGNTEFQFKAGNLNFKSMLHESGSLVISGNKATYRGDGTINGVPGFKFTLVALDGDFNSGTAPDQFRIKIWGASGIIYDNGLGADDNSDVSTALGGGSIVIHTPKGKAQEIVTKGTPIIMEDLQPEILETLAVSPNPVVSESTIRFSVKEDAIVTLRVYDYSGKMIETLFTGTVKALENYDVDFQRRNLMSGIYILKLTTATGNSYDKRILVE